MSFEGSADEAHGGPGERGGPEVRYDLEGRYREIENVFITLSDGCRLAARMWMPTTAESEPVPAIFEYIPYRKRDFMRERDEPIHRWFAAHGLAAVRVDVRGSGDSEGLLADEYSPAEIDDALEVLAWIAAQPWCDGKVGMFGISWGGINALQVAARRPPQLRAVITLCSTDDRYADDAHYMGGCLLNENLQWGSILTLYNTLPPDPEIVGERWRDMWLERVDSTPAFPALWMEHPWRDHYWQRGSVCEDLARIRCPVYAIGGWADGYSNTVPRLLAGLGGPRKGLVGPWAHIFPHRGYPGPAIGFLQEAQRWWDHWLRGRETGIMDEPQYRVWMQESVPPQPQYSERPGRWVAEDSWPSARIEPLSLYLTSHGLRAEAGSTAERRLSSPQTTGAVAGEWCAFGADGELPLDQRPDDGRSLVFDSEPLGERLEILGAPRVTLTIASDSPVAMIAVRLNDVAPDGSSARVSYALLNLTHREGHAAPRPLEPGRQETIVVQLNDAAHAFPRGHRLRLAISTAYWPIAWPSPTPVMLTVTVGDARLELPRRPPRQADAQLPPFAAAEEARGSKHRPMRPLPFRRTVERDLTTNELVYTLSSDGGEFGGHALVSLDEIGLELGYTLRKRHWIAFGDPLSARTELQQTVVMRRGEWEVRLALTMALACGHDSFQLNGELEAFEGDARVRLRRFDHRLPRRLV